MGLGGSGLAVLLCCAVLCLVVAVRSDQCRVQLRVRGGQIVNETEYMNHFRYSVVPVYASCLVLRSVVNVTIFLRFPVRWSWYIRNLDSWALRLQR